MPEVCEVALTAQGLNKALKGKILKKVEFTTGRYSGDRKKPEGYEEAIESLPMTVTKVDSKGKFMWFELENDDEKLFIWNTFGLSGSWSFEKDTGVRAEFVFKDRKVYYYDQRNFGTFKFSSSKNELNKKLKTLAPDFLKEEVDISAIRNYNKPIVQLLMDQKKIGSGIGNYLAPEILYRAKLSPHRTGESLSKKDVKKLSYWIQYMTKLCYENNYIGYMDSIETDFLNMRRKNYHPDIDLDGEEFDFMVYQRSLDPKGNPVVRDSIVKDRGTYWVPNVQK